MRVFVPKIHGLHSPEYEFNDSKLIKYQESPDRIDKIVDKLSINNRYIVTEVTGKEKLSKNGVHFDKMIEIFENIRTDKYLIPDTFNIKRIEKEPEECSAKLGMYLFDTATPFGPNTADVLRNSFMTIKEAVNHIKKTKENVYVAIRPPGHHAGYDFFGGYCYMNNAAIAAVRLKKTGKVAILDIDYHHGNGTQDIFYYSDVLYVSLHADPATEFPSYWGYAEESGEGEGYGYNVNIPLARGTKRQDYLMALRNALEIISGYSPTFLILSLGLDIYKGDPLGTFDIDRDGLNEIGMLIRVLGIPVLIVQEGGYAIDEIGDNIEAILEPFS